MDIASLVGLIGAVGAILAAMIAGGGVAPFIDTQSIFIVFGGTFFAVMYANPLPVFLGSFGAMAKAFMPPIKKLDETCLLYTSPSPRDLSTSRMPSSA